MSTYATTTWNGHLCTIVPRIAVISRPTNPINPPATSTSSSLSLASSTADTLSILQPAPATVGIIGSSAATIAVSSSTTLPNGGNSNSGGVWSTNPASLPSSAPSHGSNIAATVGGVMGTVGVIIIATIVWLLFRRRRQRLQQWNERFLGDLLDSSRSADDFLQVNEKMGLPTIIEHRQSPPLYPSSSQPNGLTGSSSPHLPPYNPFADPPPPLATTNKKGNLFDQFDFFPKRRRNPLITDDSHSSSPSDLSLPNEADTKRTQSVDTTASGSNYSVNTIIDLPGRPQIQFDPKDGANAALTSEKPGPVTETGTRNPQPGKLDDIDVSGWRRPKDRDRDTLVTVRSDPFDLEMDGTRSPSSRTGSWAVDDIPAMPDDAQERRSQFLMAGFEGRISRIGKGKG